MKIKRESNVISHVALNKLISDAGQLQLKVGYFSSNIYPPEYSRTGKLIRKSIPVAQAAAINEFGVPEKHIPRRSFLRPTIDEQKEIWAKESNRLAKRIISGALDTKSALKLLGEKAIGDFKQKILAIHSPPLSPLTIEKRLSKYSNKKKVGALDKPLIDSGLMLATITLEIE